MDKTLLHILPEETADIPSPLLFTYPFQYEPHPLCVAAVEDIKPACRQLLRNEKGGKMFGVLIVEKDGLRYYLAAFSGILEGTYLHPGFVPPVYNLQNPGSYFQQEERAISNINQRIAEGEDTEELRTERKLRSKTLQRWLFAQFDMLNAFGEKQNLIKIFENQPHILSEEEYFKRKKKGGNEKHDDNNNNENEKHIISIPAGSGECCAPKLLQYAYANHLRPLCMAEFWLGPSPKDELRIDSNYYPACHAKCKPILSHMLVGLDMEENPMLKKNREMVAEVKWLYEDSDIAVLYKPSGLLSAPGKDDVPSLLDVVRERYPEAMYAHRLDMDTSGIIVFALNDIAYKHLQNQFYRHEVKKHYIAILDGEVSAGIPRTGTISLPLLPNPYDRPRQMVNHEHGKQAITHYEILSVENGRTRIKYNPQTGRTHQLRVHSAHPEGLACPILGDNLYGTPSDRLYLHAEQIEFTHPTSAEWVKFTYPLI